MIETQSWTRRLLLRDIPLVFYTVFLLFPFYWMLVVSLKPDQDLFNVKLNPYWVQHINFSHYAYLFNNTSFVTWAVNTTVVTVTATLLSIVCSILIGYGLGRLRFAGSNAIGVGIFLAYLVPPTLLFLPLAQIINSLHLY